MLVWLVHSSQVVLQPGLWDVKFGGRGSPVQSRGRSYKIVTTDTKLFAWYYLRNSQPPERICNDIQNKETQWNYLDNVLGIRGSLYYRLYYRCNFFCYFCFYFWCSSWSSHISKLQQTIMRNISILKRCGHHLNSDRDKPEGLDSLKPRFKVWMIWDYRWVPNICTFSLKTFSPIIV